MAVLGILSLKGFGWDWKCEAQTPPEVFEIIQHLKKTRGGFGALEIQRVSIGIDGWKCTVRRRVLEFTEHLKKTRGGFGAFGFQSLWMGFELKRAKSTGST